MTDRTDHSEVVGHTPGPLVVWHQPADCRSGDGLDWSIQTEDGRVLALVALSVGKPADLHLWASAPALLEGLQFVFDQLDELINRHYGGELPCTDEEIERFAKARAAIQAATGGSDGR